MIIDLIISTIFALYYPLSYTTLIVKKADWFTTGSFVLSLVLITYLRFANLRTLVLPLWVDSVHHSALAHLIAEQGTLPTSYRPFADVDTVYYHLGFHTLVVAVSWLTGLDIEQTILWLGQFLNALVCVSIYVLAARWTGRALGGLVAMIIVGTVSLMPAYYVTWGRYTQLYGLVILPIAMLSFQSALTQGGKQRLLIASILAAGLFFIHYRVLVFLATFIVAYLSVHTSLALWHRQSPLKLWTRSLTIFFCALLFAAPWLWRVLSTTVFPLGTFTARFGTTSEANAIPYDLFQTGNMPLLLILAACSVVLTLWRGQTMRQPQIIILVWLGLTAVVHNPTWFGLPLLWILENMSAVISLFLPLSVLIACGIVTLWQIIEARLSESRKVWGERFICVGLVMAAFWFGRNMIDIVNPVTVLAESDDLVAMQWIRQSTPTDAKFLVNMRMWLTPIYAGTDAGYWIPNLTGRRTTMPIVFYIQGTYAYWHDDINTLAARVETSAHPDDPTFLAMLRARNVTHVYIGAKGGPLSLSQFLASPHYQLLFKHNTVHIFAIHYPP